MQVYILRSNTLNRYYVGIAANVHVRLKQHRHGQSCWSRRADDWTLVFTKAVATTVEARRLEKAIKARGARRFLDGPLPNPAAAGQG
jgi:predicted GIY-YIG superfamily endonuclease